ncbi:hypothetical protein HMF8227_02553 [Saliniradius amylolyticus]|uniref:TonB-dependent receptor n=1 Tax=Saliniradius amylolyticus TaxID=2183582 RepID=A0A2S2E5S3_9ALTE|nr:TonB-dependent receptor [Saliniradius amylolyticus]AWL13005.1 hypothetical protein HMF8227_02553 [Saliniradius amylolyticus]
MKYPCLTVLPLVLSGFAFAQQQEHDDLEVVEVTGSAIEQQFFSPKDALIDGPFGPNQTLSDIARSVTPLSQAMMDNFNIDDLHDVVNLVPNTFAASGFGNPSLPTIRGQLGEVFQNGLRRQGGNNGFGIPLSFNAIEQMDVVKGAPPVILGTTQRNGGFVNLHNKTASLKQGHTQLQGGAGSYNHYRGQVDTNWLIDQGHQALRTSVEVIDNGSFYDFAHFNSEDLYLTYAWQPEDGLRWDLSLEYYDVDYTDNAGLNRPTQDLIDHGLYVTGQGVQPNGSAVPGAFAIVSPTGEVNIPRSRVLTHPGDQNRMDTWLLHSTLDWTINDTHRLINRSYVQHLDRYEVAQNSFVEIIDGARTLENRTEIHSQWSDGQSTSWGLNLRYNRVRGFSQFTTEADLPIDLTGPVSNREIPLTDAQKARLVELEPGVFVSPGAQYDLNGDGNGDFNLSDTTDSIGWQTGLFAQHISRWTEKWHTTLGLRADYYDVTAQDALPPAGVTERARDSLGAWLYSWSVSTRYHLSQDWVAYAAYDYSEATSNSMAGGTVLGAGNKISPLNFATENKLAEMGIKYTPQQSPWYAALAVFDQTRSLRNRDGSNSGVTTKGFEVELFYQTDSLWANMGYSYLDAEFDNSAAFQDSRQVHDAFDNSRPDIIQGTGVGAPNFAAFPPSDQQLHGLPEQMVTAGMGYWLTPHWNLSANARYTKSYPLDYLQTVMIRDQIQLDLNTHYELSDRLSLKLAVLNATDEDNWQPVFEGGYFGSTLVMPQLPRRAELTLTYQL